eukprot:scaffold6070_cov41-Cyclotella_meneghiniana.AAC.2
MQEIFLPPVDSPFPVLIPVVHPPAQSQRKPSCWNHSTNRYCPQSKVCRCRLLLRECQVRPFLRPWALPQVSLIQVTARCIDNIR